MSRPCLSARRRAATQAFVLALVAVPLAGCRTPAAPSALVTTAATPVPAAPAAPAPPAELYEVVQVVDGDTIHVLRDGEREKLRLLSVDTEEKLAPGMTASPSKPQTVFGEETALWARELFAALAREQAGGVARVGLRFPPGPERRDVYGRLLCHVLLPDGTDFNLLLVELGKSPYFDKYGRSRICHEAFVAAQERARARRLGIWDPRTNVPSDPAAPAAVRPYARLLPWWRARSDAIEDFRRRAGPRVIEAEDADALAAAARLTGEVEVFGEPERFFDESDGSLTVLFRASERGRAFRARIPAAARAAHEALELRALARELRQNFVYVSGDLVGGERGLEIVTSSPGQWRRAGPEPRLDEP